MIEGQASAIMDDQILMRMRMITAQVLAEIDLVAVEALLVGGVKVDATMTIAQVQSMRGIILQGQMAAIIVLSPMPGTPSDLMGGLRTTARGRQLVGTGVVLMAAMMMTAPVPGVKAATVQAWILVTTVQATTISHQASMVGEQNVLINGRRPRVPPHQHLRATVALLQRQTEIVTGPALLVLVAVSNLLADHPLFR